MTSLAFPFTIDSSGGVAVRTDRVSAANDRILNVLMTIPYERVMRPVFGGGIPGLVFSAMGDEIVSSVKEQVTNSLTLFVPEVSVVQVNVFPDPHTEGQLNIEAYYRMTDEIDGSTHLATVEVGNFTETTF